MNSMDIECFQSLDANPGETLQKLEDERMELLFQLVFCKADGTAYEPSDGEKKAMLLFKGGPDMKNLFQHIGKVINGDNYTETVKEIKDGLISRTNSVVQRNMLLANHPQGRKSFEKWSQEVSNAAKLISYTNYNWQQAAVDAMMLQTSNAKLRERCLQDNVSYDDMMKLGISKEQSIKGAALLEQASGHSSTDKATEEVRRLKLENKKLKSHLPAKECSRCGSDKCKKGNKCPAMGQTCSACKKLNHFRSACQISSAEDSDSYESIQRIVVGKLGKNSISATVEVEGILSPGKPTSIKLATDTGISKTL